ncbi:PadR family transcriptional regulator [Clostridiaceae bacterium HSG29]|nr:PadR family transcriptional regulator [Clostridiaceae bacterium HSG29]
MKKSIQEAYLPMSETAYFILLSLTTEKHGYGIIQYVEKITNGRLHIGAGTIYGTLSKFEKDNLIKLVGEKERRKIYKITETGNLLLQSEIRRIEELFKCAKDYLER